MVDSGRRALWRREAVAESGSSYLHGCVSDSADPGWRPPGFDIYTPRPLSWRYQRQQSRRYERNSKTDRRQPTAPSKLPCPRYNNCLSPSGHLEECVPSLLQSLVSCRLQGIIISNKSGLGRMVTTSEQVWCDRDQSCFNWLNRVDC